MSGRWYGVGGSAPHFFEFDDDTVPLCRAAVVLKPLSAAAIVRRPLLGPANMGKAEGKPCQRCVEKVLARYAPELSVMGRGTPAYATTRRAPAAGEDPVDGTHPGCTE